MTSNLAIIPARGGSKRIPGKNIRPFAGKPVIAHAIAVAIESECFSRVMVSTDSQEIAEVAIACGAQVPFFRSAATSSDHATTMEVLREVLECYESNGTSFDKGCCIYPCTPFLRAARIREAMEILDGEAPPVCVFGALRYPHPIQRAFQIEAGRARFAFPEHSVTGTGDLVPMFHDAAQFYAFRVEALLLEGRIIGPKSAPIVLPYSEAHDIDTPDDWAEAELKFRLLNEQQGA